MMPLNCCHGGMKKKQKFQKKHFIQAMSKGKFISSGQPVDPDEVT